MEQIQNDNNVIYDIQSMVHEARQRVAVAANATILSDLCSVMSTC